MSIFLPQTKITASNPSHENQAASWERLHPPHESIPQNQLWIWILPKSQGGGLWKFASAIVCPPET